MSLRVWAPNVEQSEYNFTLFNTLIDYIYSVLPVGEEEEDEADCYVYSNENINDLLKVLRAQLRNDVKLGKHTDDNSSAEFKTLLSVYKGFCAVFRLGKGCVIW